MALDNLGIYIRKLLRINNKTKQNLANILSINVTGIDMLLNGTTTFSDNQINLIAEFFQKSPSEIKDFDEIELISEYEKIETYDQYKAYALIMDMTDLDFYDRYLIDYLIEKDNLVLITELTINNSLEIKESNLKKDSLLNLIIYLANHDLNPLHYLEVFQTLNKGFKEINREKDFYEAIDKFNNPEVLTYLFVDVKKEGIEKAKKQFIKNDTILTVCAKYHLQNLFNYCLDRFKSYLNTLLLLIDKEFYEGTVTYVTKYYEEIKAKPSNYFKIIRKAIDAKNDQIFAFLMEKNLCATKQKTLITALLWSYPYAYNYIYDNYFDELVPYELAYYTSAVGDLDFFKKMFKYLNNDTISLCLMLTKENDLPFNNFLIANGAQFQKSGMNMKNINKMNALINYYKKGE